MRRFRRELTIDMVIHRGIFKINQNTLFPYFTFIKHVWKYVEQGLICTVVYLG